MGPAGQGDGSNPRLEAYATQDSDPGTIEPMIIKLRQAVNK